MRRIKTYQSFTESASAELRNTLKDLGYEEKGSEITSGGEITDDISKIGKVILEEFKKVAPNNKVKITGGNDAFHHNLSYVSRHAKGEALDITINPDSNDDHNKFLEILNRIAAGNPGFSYIDEYRNPSHAATGGHFHISYKPNAPEKSVKINTSNPIKVEGLSGVALTGAVSNIDSVVIDSDLIERMIKELKAKNFSQEKLDGLLKK
jgi:hypothetical protein